MTVSVSLLFVNSTHSSRALNSAGAAHQRRLTHPAEKGNSMIPQPSLQKTHFCVLCGSGQVLQAMKTRAALSQQLLKAHNTGVAVLHYQSMQAAAEQGIEHLQGYESSHGAEVTQGEHP